MTWIVPFLLWITSQATRQTRAIRSSASSDRGDPASSDPSTQSCAGYTLPDAFASWAPGDSILDGRLRGLRLDAGVDNLTDQNYQPYQAGVSAQGRNYKMLASYALAWLSRRVGRASVRTGDEDMKITGAVALVTGANRGLGRAYVEALFAAGAAKVYAGARDPASIRDPRVTPVRLDITDPGQVAAAAALCADIDLLINNAGIMLMTPMLAEGSDEAMRREMEVNVFGTLRMIRAFAPVLAANGGGAVVNMLSVVSWFTSPFNATYGASKHAELSVSDAARIQLRAQGTRVISVYAGYIDTDMAAGIDAAKVSPREVAEHTLQGVETGLDHVLVGARAHEIWQAQRASPVDLEASLQAAWDASRSAEPTR